MPIYSYWTNGIKKSKELYSMLLKRLTLGTVFGFIGLMVANSSAQAALLGDNVRAEFSGVGLGTLLDETAVTVDPGIEFSLPGLFDSLFSLDVRNNSFDIIYDVADFTGSLEAPTSWTISDLDWVDTPGIITDVTLESGNASLISNISFTDDSVTVDIIQYSIPPQNSVETWTFDIQTKHESVPEPATILGLLTFTGLGLATRLNRNIG
ncbi:MAG: PEP-CTERM sorting domain-containing protein [Trichodesmium sp. MO_231.B1]|nr:PEP-CTERM sorting domain-containing protein [Trichodesmium sp. MO_231.B1]